ncbi:hypothetical protein HanRHA438_Chr06g0264431 [Helianthus annuus]|nr:hypothetical protein HanRHA438_Chr06g0264431 [Helianthus annuus]
MRFGGLLPEQKQVGMGGVPVVRGGGGCGRRSLVNRHWLVVSPDREGETESKRFEGLRGVLVYEFGLWFIFSVYVKKL